MKFVRVRSEKRKQVVRLIIVLVLSLASSIFLQNKIGKYADDSWIYYCSLTDVALVTIFLVAYIILRLNFQKTEAFLDTRNKVFKYRGKRIYYDKISYTQTIGEKILGLYRLEITYRLQKGKKIKRKKIKLKNITKETIE